MKKIVIQVIHKMFLNVCCLSILYNTNQIIIILGTYNGLVRLTHEGTTYFNNLSDSNKSDFLDQLKYEISLILPVGLDRLNIKNYQIDTSTPSDQLIISLQIEETRDLSKRNTERLKEDLDVLIRNKDYTGISKHDHTKLLDNEYGYQLNGNYYDVYYEFVIQYV